jgi:hypothetical protein
MLATPQGTLATIRIALPQTTEGGADACPDPGTVAAGVPAPLRFWSLAQRASSFHFLLDGVVVRRRLDPLRIETGIVHDGEPLPPIDCHEGFLLVCSTAGSIVHDAVTIDPVED